MSCDWAGDFERLMEAVLDGRATPAEHARLEELLTAHPEALDAYVQFMSLDTMLQTLFAPERLAAENEPGPSGGRRPAAVLPFAADKGDGLSVLPVARPPSPVRGFLGNIRRWGRGFLSEYVGALALLAGLLLVALLGTWGLIASRNGPVAPPPTAQQPQNSEVSNPESEISDPPSRIPNPRSSASFRAPLARLVRTKDCRWNGPAPVPAVDQPLVAGQSLHLAAGVAEIEFEIGAKVILQSPAAFQLLSATTARLELGKATVEITDERARGFRIRTPETTFVDQGTEFGVEAAPGGSSKIHVFKGQVDVERTARNGQAARLTQRLAENAGARIAAGEDGMTLVADTGECFIRSLGEADRDRHVVAYWRFEDRPVGILLPNTGHNSLGVCATVDSSFNGNDLYTGNTKSQPMFSADVPAAAVAQTDRPNRSCLDTSQPTVDSSRMRNVYTHSKFSHAAPLDIQRIAPAQWTIEASVKVAKLFGKPQGFLGRDANFTYEEKRAPARLTFQINARDRFAIGFYDADGRCHEAAAEDLPVEAGRWYHLAATSDGRVLRLYVDVRDGHGYVERAATDLPATGSTALGKGRDDAEWTIGRAGNAGDPADWLRFWGWIDEVRISDIARQPQEFLFTPRDEQP